MIMATKAKGTYWELWLWWVIATICGIEVGFLIARSLAGGIVGTSISVGSEPSSVVLRGSAAGAIIGTAVGVSQWLALKSRGIGFGHWVPASALGFAAGAALFFVVGYIGRLADRQPLGQAVAFGVGLFVWGVALGIAQGPVLRRSVPSSHWWWVVSNSIGMTCGFGMFVALDLTMLRALESSIALVLSLVAWGAGMGMITGVVLLALITVSIKVNEDPGKLSLPTLPKDSPT